MFTLALIGFLGGLITGISPCILPVLPVIFFSGTQSTRADATGTAGGVAVEAKPTLSDRLRPYRVIGGLVLSFSVVTWRVRRCCRCCTCRRTPSDGSR